MPMRLRDWLKDVVADPEYEKHIWWNDISRGLIAIHWKHASYEDYDEQDSALFKKWAMDNRRYDPTAADSHEERKRWKTNFRCALHSATNIRTAPVKCMARNDKRSYRVYELLDNPDPQKVDQKKKSNQLAAKSKRKPNNMKRGYHSRLNKTDVVIKQEPKEVCRGNRNSQGKKQPQQSKACVETEELLNDIESELCASKTISMHTGSWYDNESSAQPSPEPESLPATLDMFNDEEDRDDGGYYSASDSSSVNSMAVLIDSNMAVAGTDVEQQFCRGTVHSHMESVENPYARQYYTVIPLANAERDFADYPTSDLSDSVYLTHNSTAYEVSSTPNVSTEIFMEQEITIPTAVRYSSSPDACMYEYPYCLTSL